MQWVPDSPQWCGRRWLWSLKRTDADRIVTSLDGDDSPVLVLVAVGPIDRMLWYRHYGCHVRRLQQSTDTDRQRTSRMLGLLHIKLHSITLSCRKFVSQAHEKTTMSSRTACLRPVFYQVNHKLKSNACRKL